MPSHRAAPPRRRIAPPLLVAGVSGVLAVVIGTAQASGVAPMASDGDTSPASPQAVAAQTAALPDVSQALAALAERTPTIGSRASRSAERAALHTWVRPDSGPLSSPFGWRWGSLHPGIDLAGPYGSPILAATDGCIEQAGVDGGYGNRILMRDWDGTETLYGHMSAFVRTSGCVSAGTVIGREGSTGFSTGPHLHFEVHVNGVPIDPIPFLERRGVRV